MGNSGYYCRDVQPRRGELLPGLRGVTEASDILKTPSECCGALSDPGLGQLVVGGIRSHPTVART